MKEFTDSPIILGRPFLATAKAITDWGKGEVIFQVGDSTMKVSINKLMRHPSHESDEVGAVDIYEDPTAQNDRGRMPRSRSDRTAIAARSNRDRKVKLYRGDDGGY